jgi:hypothetical protein
MGDRLSAWTTSGLIHEDRDLPSSGKRFPDGGQYRIEVPSCESPEALSAVLEEADVQGVRIHRVSQGSGIMLLTDGEIAGMARLARDSRIELSLFVGPRATYDTSPQPHTPAGRVIGGSLRGASQLLYAVEDVKRACALGIRSVLVADLGLIRVLDELKRAGELPAGLVIKVSLLFSVPNPATARVLEDLGASTLNLSPDLSLAHTAGIRAAVDLPLDWYVEVPDGFGGYVRYFEAPEMIRVASPIYLKLGLRNAPDIYPSGQHLHSVGLQLARERVRRGRILTDMIERCYPDAVPSPADTGGPGIPEC